MGGIPGRKPLPMFGGHTEWEKRAAEVFQIIRTLGAEERSPVRFREITARLVPPLESNDTTWRRVTAQRAINRLRKEGWIEKTVGGYRALDPPLYPFYALRTELEKILDRGIHLLDVPPERSGVEDREWLREADGLSLDLAAVLGLWVRAVDRRLLDRARALGYLLGRNDAAGLGASDGADSDRTPGFRAGALAYEVIFGYLTPEADAATGISGLHEKETTSLRAFHQEVERLRKCGQLRQPGTDRVQVDEEYAKMLQRSQRTARVLRPLRTKALRALRSAWAHELEGGYNRIFE